MHVTVASGSLELMDERTAAAAQQGPGVQQHLARGLHGPGVCIMSASMQGASALLQSYPQTTAVSFTVLSAGVESAHHGVLLSTQGVGTTSGNNGMHSDLNSSGTSRAPAPPSPLRSPSPQISLLQAATSAAFAVDFTSKPQDGSADAVVGVRLAPSYVTFAAGAVAEVVSFFETEQAVDMVTLQVGLIRITLTQKECVRADPSI